MPGGYDPSAHGLPKAHYIHTGANGKLDSTTTADVDSIVAALKDQQRIVLHFHGGLVPEANGTAAAKSLLDVYRGAGAYPVFFIWQSGLVDVLVDNFREVAGEGIFKQLEKIVTKFVVAKVKDRLNGKGVSLNMPKEREVLVELARKNRGEEPYRELTPPDDLAELSDEEAELFQAEVMASPDVQAEVAAITREYLPERIELSKSGQTVREVASYRTLMSPEVVDQVKAEADDPSKGIFGAVTIARLAAKVLKAVISRLVARRDHGVYPTVVEEILRVFYLANVGERIWTVMKDETLQTFEGTAEVRGGRYFMKGLADVIRAGARPELTLVGHSTGAVFINNLLNHIDALRSDPNDPFPQDFRVKNVVFLAPACTFDAFAPVVEKQGSLFETFRMFTMKDELETADHLVPVLYPRSLLYLISGILEKEPDGKSSFDKPVVGMQRYYTKTDVYDTPEVVTVREFVTGTPGRVLWSTDDTGPGFASGADSHSEFDEDELVRASMRVIIGDG